MKNSVKVATVASATALNGLREVQSVGVDLGRAWPASTHRVQTQPNPRRLRLELRSVSNQSLSVCAARRSLPLTSRNICSTAYVHYEAWPLIAATTATLPSASSVHRRCPTTGSCTACQAAVCADKPSDDAAERRFYNL